MKLGINEISEGIYISAKNKVVRQLQREGFKIYNEYAINNYNNKYVLDLFAVKGSDKRIYEFKIGKNKIQRNQFELLQGYAKSIGARLLIIYLEIPFSKEIIFDKIEDIIFDNLNDDPPNDLLELATHVYINYVHKIDLNSIKIQGDIISLTGTGIITLETQMGSNRDFSNDDGYHENFDFEFSFKLRLDQFKRKIIYSYYKFDTSNYYA